MAVYIKGMEMPKTCWDCPMMYDYLYCVVTMDKKLKEEARADSCPLVYVHEPHGRLIDADACIDYVCNNNQQAWEALAYEPTVIEGSE